eukprot:Gb_18169 [translate_table: standard]
MHHVVTPGFGVGTTSVVVQNESGRRIVEITPVPMAYARVTKVMRWRMGMERKAKNMMSILLLVAIICHRSFHQRKLNLPPGPASLPMVGNLHMLGKLPHRALSALSKKYGPLMFMRVGSVPTVVASSPDMAKEILKIHDLAFASRPESNAAKCIFNKSPERLKSFSSVREEEVSFMIQSILEDSVKGSNPVNVSKKVGALAAGIICRIIFGRKYSDEMLGSGGFSAVIQEVLLLLGAFNIGDFIPYLEWMDVQGLNRRFCKTHKTLDAFLEKIIEEHAEAQSDGLNTGISWTFYLQCAQDMLVAGVDTSSTTLEWAMSELLRNPSVINKIQDELRSVIGPNRRVEESDLPRLRYLQAVVKETLRLYPPGPLLIAHESTESCDVSGYEMPASTRVIVNAWAIGRDPKSWEDAEKFMPERFIGSSVDVIGQQFEVIPFGSGRRRCPGMNLGIVVVELHLPSSSIALIGDFLMEWTPKCWI